MVLGFKKGGQEYEKGGEGNQGMWSKVMACWGGAACRDAGWDSVRALCGPGGSWLPGTVVQVGENGYIDHLGRLLSLLIFSQDFSLSLLLLGLLKCKY